MIVLDENILDAQRLLLEASRVSVRQIGVNFGRKGLKDAEVIMLLRELRRTTFFTRDAGFYSPKLRHPGYCLVVLSLGQHEVASFARRLLCHPSFDTQAKRAGSVVRISPTGLAFWRLRHSRELRERWSGRG